jgi:hypothetical protein
VAPIEPQKAAHQATRRCLRSSPAIKSFHAGLSELSALGRSLVLASASAPPICVRPCRRRTECRCMPTYACEQVVGEGVCWDGCRGAPEPPPAPPGSCRPGPSGGSAAAAAPAAAAAAGGGCGATAAAAAAAARHRGRWTGRAGRRWGARHISAHSSQTPCKLGGWLAFETHGSCFARLRQLALLLPALAPLPVRFRSASLMRSCSSASSASGGAAAAAATPLARLKAGKKGAAVGGAPTAATTPAATAAETAAAAAASATLASGQQPAASGQQPAASGQRGDCGDFT